MKFRALCTLLVLIAPVGCGSGSGSNAASDMEESRDSKSFSADVTRLELLGLNDGRSAETSGLPIQGQTIEVIGD